jgi:glycosyltransferase involved in cell wall biosynthesis
MRVALVHYWLVGMRGGEKVLEEMCRIWPDADIFTHVFEPGAISDTIRQHRVSTSLIQRLPAARRLYKKYLPLMPLALESLDLSPYDLVISSEAGPAKGILVRPDAIHICYCHSPMRYIWDQFFLYRARAGLFTKLIMSAALPSLRQWDAVTATRVDHFVANSAFVAQRIEKYYRRASDVVHPPVAIEKFSISDEIDDYYFTCGQLVGYKRFDLAVEAFSRLGKRLIVAGTGEEAKRLRALAGPTVEFAGWVSDEEVARLLRRCRAFIFPGIEDFGIAAVEAMASGRPVIAYASGGALETVVDGVTGLYFHEASVASLTRAVLDFESRVESFDPQLIRAHSRKFDRARFQVKLKAVVARQFNTRSTRQLMRFSQSKTQGDTDIRIAGGDTS